MRRAVLLSIFASSALGRAEQQHAFGYEDDFAQRKWSALPDAGRPTRVVYPPPGVSETFDPSAVFPTPTQYLGPVKPGDEAAAAENDVYPPPLRGPLVAPVRIRGSPKHFDAPSVWGNLSPYNSLPHPPPPPFLSTPPRIPDGCSLQQLHVLHRHGVRYPEEEDPPHKFADRLHKVVKHGKGFTARGELAFLNQWRYRLGSESLAPLGRAQMFNLGVDLRMKYGAVLKEYTEHLPVFRTTSQDRMLQSAINFAAGFFGIPVEGKYYQLVTIEENGFNNTLAPHKICDNLGKAGKGAAKGWSEVFLKDAHERLRLQIEGFELAIQDVFAMLQICAYETLALGASPFCPLFTAKEHEGLGYAASLRFHASSFGHAQTGPANGIGWARELLARLTSKSIPAEEATRWGLNATEVLDDRKFPLHKTGIWVDATHDTVVAGALAALNITALNPHGAKRLPRKHISKKAGRFDAAHVVPFGANLVGQVLDCRGTDYVRWVLNDGVLPLHGAGECPESSLGLCELEVFVKALELRVEEVEFERVCNDDDKETDDE
ncbi:phosphoglycerate mutase-like protein [Auricularia subglabra TFB-10046 SS5]|nr:phosphoglycerate mutase-like protein [Auricularia subglabra TFB-10046 SS5]